VEVTFPFRDEAYILSEDKKVITEDALVLPAYSSALIRMGK
jgi:hypothetical protein